ncbi:MAG: hypothetical protein K9L28_09210 [Synergistales bacterium]|nr:hypothetical protein [Synergistales bacterium]
MKLLVAAARDRQVEGTLAAVEDAGFRVGFVEPATVGLYRAVLGPVPSYGPGYLIVSIGAFSSHIVVGYHSSGLIFRSLLVGGEHSMGVEQAVASVGQEIASTMTFARSQFRGIDINTVVLAGKYGASENTRQALAEQLPDVSFVIGAPWALWGVEDPPEEAFLMESAFGMAVRELA